MIIAILIQILFIAVNIGMAKIEADMIERNERIYHGLWMAGYISLTAITCFFYGNWWLTAHLFLVRGVVFDIALNRFRGLATDYTSSKTSSFTDAPLLWIFGGDFFLQKIVFAALLITANLLLFTHVI